MIINERQRTILNNAADVLYSLASHADNKMTERHFEKIADMLDQILCDLAEENENE